MMKNRIENRLQELREEFENGQKMLGDLENRESKLREMLLRISGAIQVLEEELSLENKEIENGNVKDLVSQGK